MSSISQVLFTLSLVALVVDASVEGIEEIEAAARRKPEPSKAKKTGEPVIIEGGIEQIEKQQGKSNPK